MTDHSRVGILMNKMFSLSESLGSAMGPCGFTLKGALVISKDYCSAKRREVCIESNDPVREQCLTNVLLWASLSKN